jgi:hypothetical protein
MEHVRGKNMKSCPWYPRSSKKERMPASQEVWVGIERKPYFPKCFFASWLIRESPYLTFPLLCAFSYHLAPAWTDSVEDYK